MHRKLGEILIGLAVITEEQLQHALRMKEIQGNKKIGKILIEMGYVTSEQITKALSIEFNMPIVSCADTIISSELENIIPKDFAEKNLVFPVSKKGNTLILAVANPLDYILIDDIAFRTKLNVTPVIAYEWSIRKAIENNYMQESKNFVDTITDGMDEYLSDKEVQFMPNGEREAEDVNVEALYSKSNYPPIVKLVAMLIAEAIKLRASDIHIEPHEKNVQIRYRIDGELLNISRYNKNIHDSVVSRIKIISNLNITNRNLPQDGGSHVLFQGKEVDLRISTAPSIYGETVVIRLLVQGAGITPLEGLGMPQHIITPIIELLKQPQGMLIVTGPTGSGKTTTLYACLSHMLSGSRNIITIEDPVEYKINGITQIQVNEVIGRTFAAILRSVFRQDPDVIKIGEIRDFETAEIAIKASLTGHVVLTTLHTNNTVATITRLRDIGVQSYLISSAVSGILAQRLVRKICKNCRAEADVDGKLLEKITALNYPLVTKHYYGTGCAKCSHTGYYGRTAVYEYLPIKHSFKKLISENRDEEELLAAAENEGVVLLFEDAWNKVMDGITSIQEVMAKVPWYSAKPNQGKT